MPGRRKPLRPALYRMLSHINNTYFKAKHDVSDLARQFAQENDVPEAKLVDVSIQFIGASGLPKMDLVGSADPYFVAKLDDKITFVSTVQPNTLTPVWNEAWNVKNVPENAVLKVDVLDKDEGSINDDYIGKLETTLSQGPKEVEIVSTILKKVKGTFWLKISTTPSADTPGATRHLYTFDGPIRYSRHNSPTIGHLTKIDDSRLYSTWKMQLKGVPLYFGDEYQHWNTSYRAAQAIFGCGPTSIAIRSSIQAGHRMLYARSTRNGFGLIESYTDVIGLLRGGGGRDGDAHRIKPAVYTYVISEGDDALRFSETGAAFFVDFASKHALHANCAPRVRYSGEFHPRPVGGWDAFSDATPDDQVQWEIVVDNNSGTYSPDAMLLPNLRDLLEYNFPGLHFVALDFKDPALEQSREACRAYALNHRGVHQNELQPHASEGEETLQQHAITHEPATELTDEQPPSEEAAS